MEDPGWSNIAKNAAWGLVPGLALRRAQRTRGIEALRAVFVGFVFAVLLFGVVLAFLPLKRADPGWSATGALAAVGIVGVACLCAVVVLHRKPLDHDSVGSLAQSYRKTFFLKIAFSESVALVAFVLSFLAASHLVYPLGLAFTLVGFGIVAPGRRDVRRRREQLRGTDLDLLVALRDVPPPARGGWPRRNEA